VKSLWVLLLASLMLSGCGGSSSSSSSQTSGPLAGNWQFTLASPADGSFVGSPNPACTSTTGTPLPICSGGFLLQNKGSVTGGVVYSIELPPSQNGGSPTLCNSGSAPVTGTVNGQNVTLTAVAGTQTFTLTGTLSSDGSTMMGTYASTDGKGCGTAQTGLQWSATSVQPLSGSVQGIFHSAAGRFQTVSGDVLVISNQNFPVFGVLTQGANIGASNATVTGTLTFQGYPCLDSASVNGQISGKSVILQIIASNGLNAGQIGSAGLASDPVSPVVYQSTQGGYVLKGAQGYGVNTPVCPVANLPGDRGDICLALGNSTSCTQPISLSPASLTFPPQALGAPPTTQTLTLTNTDPSNVTLTGLSISNLVQPNSSFGGFSDFTGLHNFTQQDTCASAPQATFSLAPQQSCSITILFSPQQSCPWLPFAPQGPPPSPLGAAPTLCPFPLTATLTVNSPTSADDLTAFAVPITGTGLSAIVPSTPELDFGAEAPSEASAAQVLSFTNQGNLPVQILPALSQPCVNANQALHTLSRPLTLGTIAGLQVDLPQIFVDTTNGPTIDYLCDSDPTSGLPNFQLFADTCTGSLLPPQASCTVQVRFAPQPGTSLVSGLDYFLELNTLQCTSTTTSNCEIDSGRFPVELTANMPSPLRMSPGAGLDFGIQAVGKVSEPLTITLFNDPSDPKAGTVNFTGNAIRGDYAETDDCSASLAAGDTCTLTITFKPKIVGFDSGTITIAYTVGQTQIIHLRGTGQ
jgi:hypothetical protein